MAMNLIIREENRNCTHGQVRHRIVEDGRAVFVRESGSRAVSSAPSFAFKMVRGVAKKATGDMIAGGRLADNYIEFIRLLLWCAVLRYVFARCAAVIAG